MKRRGATGPAAALVALAPILAWGGAADPGAGFAFVDAAPEAGLTVPTVCGLPDKPSILDGTGPGVGMLDYDGDGRLDLFLTNTSGWTTDAYDRESKYWVGKGQFEDVVDSPK
jgi:hypothetical protein